MAKRNILLRNILTHDFKGEVHINSVGIFNRFKAKLSSWLSRRIPAASAVTLSHKSIFILPTGFGLAWLLLLLMLFLLGTNYQNNLVMGLSFLLLSIFNTCILYCYRNLAGLTLSRAKTTANTFADQTCYIAVHIASKRSSYEVKLNFSKQPIEIAKKVIGQPQPALLNVLHPRRGLLKPGRVKIESRYPLGLCRAWSYVDLDIEHVIFATPIQTNNSLAISSQDPSGVEDTGRLVTGVDEFSGLKDYVKGESLKQVAWKQVAQGRGMLTKEFQQPQGTPLWLTLDTSSADLELSLSKLAWQTEQLSSKQQIFGLKLGANSIEPAKGEVHRIAVQTQIALYPNSQRVINHE